MVAVCLLGQTVSIQALLTCTAYQQNGWMDGWMDRWMEGGMDGWLMIRGVRMRRILNLTLFAFVRVICCQILWPGQA